MESNPPKAPASVLWTTAAILAWSLGLIVAGSLGEHALRSLQREHLMGIPDAPGAPLAIDGGVMPDFLWGGEAWGLALHNVRSAPLAGCLVEFDEPGLYPKSGSFTLAPGASFKLYWNHDHTNAQHTLPTRLTLTCASGTWTWRIVRQR